MLKLQAHRELFGADVVLLRLDPEVDSLSAHFDTQEPARQPPLCRAVQVGVQRQTVNIWLKRYRKQGEAGLLDGRRVSGARARERSPPIRPDSSAAGSPRRRRTS